jgi:hemoglobin
MPTSRITLGLIVATGITLVTAGVGVAQERPVAPYVQSPANAGATPIQGQAVFKAFHGRDGVQRIADDLVDRVRRDPRIADIFAATDLVRLKRTLGEQFCYILDGGCAYTGRDMRTAHTGQGLQAADFNALVEDLQAAMDRERVHFWAQNRLLAKLAPMERDVVERKSPAVLHTLKRRLSHALHPQD